jgi:integral membrane sensor domain MASE1
MSFIPHSRSEWFSEIKRGLLFLTLLFWLFFLMCGYSTGLGIYHNPRSCWVAAGLAFVALLCTKRTQRWVGILALVLAVAAALYCQKQNARMKERLQRFEAQQPNNNRPQPLNTTK